MSPGANTVTTRASHERQDLELFLRICLAIDTVEQLKFALGAGDAYFFVIVEGLVLGSAAGIIGCERRGRNISLWCLIKSMDAQ